MIFIYVLGCLNAGSILVCYHILRKKKILYDDRFTTTLTMATTGISTLVLGIHLTAVLSLDLPIIFSLNFSLGILIGILFGSLITFHSILTGLYHGMIGSSMGVMIGEVLKNPEICSIPIASKHQILLNIYQFCGFTTVLLMLVLGLVLHSLKV